MSFTHCVKNFPTEILWGRKSDLRELVIFKFQTVAHIHAKGQQGDGNLGNDAGLVILYKRVVTPNIHDGTEHNNLLVKTAPGNRGR